MAKIRMETVIAHLSPQMRGALSDAVSRVLPNARYDQQQLLSEFKKAIGRKCGTWQNVPDHCVEK